MRLRPGDAPPQASSHCSPEQATKEFLERLPDPCRLLVAFSGGGDSTGLLALLSAARRDYPNLSLHAATVDHGLRPGSAEEAESASRVSRNLGVPHAILPWIGEKPATGVQAAARDARYRLLAEEATRIGADFIVTGHTLDDQRETVFMRRQRKPELVDGMDEAVLVWRKAWVVRPLLSVRREAIRELLRSRRLAWSEDPSNDNPAFERVRVRQSGALVENMHVVEPGPNPNVVSAAFVRASVTIHAGAVAAVDLRDCHSRSRPHWTAIATLAAILGGRVHGPDTRTGAALVEKLAGPSDFRMSADRVLFDRRGDVLYLYREERGLPQIVIAPGLSALWDGRYEIVNRGLAHVVVAAGRRLTAAQRLLPEAAFDALPREVASRAGASTPRVLEGCAASTSVRMVLAPFEKFLPARKLVLADSLAEAFELERFPSLSLCNGAF
jgi:tRNA(Ile)-lysidine synthase